MAFPICIEYAGAVYHITTLGNARQSILKDDKDREVFLELLEKGLRPLLFSFSEGYSLFFYPTSFLIHPGN